MNTKLQAVDYWIGCYTLFDRIDPHKVAQPGEPLTDTQLLVRIADGISKLIELQNAGDGGNAYDQPRDEIDIRSFSVDASDGFVLPGDRSRRVLTVYNSGTVELRFFKRKGQAWAEGFPLATGASRDIGAALSTIYLRAESVAGEVKLFQERS